MGSLLSLGAATLALATPAEDAVAARRTTADFVSFHDKTRSPVAAGTHQRVSVRVRVLKRTTDRPARGRVWFVDADGVRVSPKARLDDRGRATVTQDPPPGTLPGKHFWHVRYGGTTHVEPAVSRRAVAFTVSMPPRDSTVDYRWAASPDITNEDVGDLSRMPGFDRHYGNSWNQQTENSIDWVYRTIASYDPGAFLISGDLVEGHWGLKGNTSGLFGTPEDPVGMLRNMAAFYHGENVERLEAAGLFDRTYPAIGDHDIGDNPWGEWRYFDPFKRTHLYIWRQAFADNYYYRRDGTPKFFTRPDPGSEWGRTSYAAMLSPELLLVSLDEFDRHADNVTVDVQGAQLRWLTDVLAQARRQGVRWIVVQGHTPILPARVWHSSGLHIAHGARSRLWKTLVKYRVNVYLAGEVHSTTRRTQDGVTQLITGAPITTGKTRFVTVNVFADRMEITERGWDVPENAPSVGLWQGGCSIPVVLSDPDFTEHPECVRSRVDDGSRDYTGIMPTVYGRLTVHLDGKAGAGSGELVQYGDSWSRGRQSAPRPAFGPS